MTLFVITDWALERRNATNAQKGIKMKIVLKRKLMNELMTTYVPSVLLIVITWATTFFKPYYFEAALSVNLTTMLVMTTIFIGVMESLPSTAYVKMIDAWLLFGQLIPFTEVILLTIMEYVREGDGSGEGDQTTKDINQPQVIQPVQQDLKEGDESSTVSNLDGVTAEQSQAPKTPKTAWKDREDPTKVYRVIGERGRLEQYSAHPKPYFREDSASSGCVDADSDLHDRRHSDVQ